MKHFTLHTERLTIEPHSVADASFFLKLLNDPSYIQFIGDRNVNTLDDARAYLTGKLLKHIADNGFGFNRVSLNDGTIIGTCGFIKRPELPIADFGFAYLTDFQGKGYGTEASKAILEYGKNTLNFKKVMAVVQEDNPSSIGLLEKIGFINTGQTIRLNNEEIDLLLFENHLNR